MFICAEPSIVRTNDWEKEYVAGIVDAIYLLAVL